MIDGREVLVKAVYRPLPQIACGGIVRDGSGEFWLLLTPAPQVRDMLILAHLDTVPAGTLAGVSTLPEAV